MMRKSLRLMVSALVAFAITSSIALAAVNVKSYPVATFGDPDAASVTLRGGNFSGLGSVPANATLTVQGSVRYDCANPQGHLSPGQNPVAAQPGQTGAPSGRSSTRL